MKKRILCYGDSNTWGSGSFGGRLDDEKQWPNILQTLLPRDFKVVQEGLNGRIAGDFDIAKPYRNGKTSFEVMLRSAAPDIVIIALGTNDIKTRYNRKTNEIVADLMWYAQFTRQLERKDGRDKPKVIYLLPANFVPNKYFEATEALRQEVIAKMKQANCDYVEVKQLDMVEDGVHYSIEAHEKVAKVVYEKIEEMEKSHEI